VKGKDADEVVLLTSNGLRVQGNGSDTDQAESSVPSEGSVAQASSLNERGKKTETLQQIVDCAKHFLGVSVNYLSHFL